MAKAYHIINNNLNKNAKMPKAYHIINNNLNKTFVIDPSPPLHCLSRAEGKELMSDSCSHLRTEH
jgi:hypothetical protein